MIKMFVYNHCPFCIKTRMVANMTGLDYELIILANDDEQSHIEKIGSKQVPFLQKPNGDYIKESEAICNYIVKYQKFVIGSTKNNSQLNLLIKELHQMSKTLTYPRIPHHFQNSEDFPTQSAKDYFIAKKSAYIGDMQELYINPPKDTITKTQAKIYEINKHIQYPFVNGYEFSWDDINIFPFLSIITIIKDLVHIPKSIQKYLNSIESKTNIELYK